MNKIIDYILLLRDIIFKTPNLKNGFIETPYKKIKKAGDYEYRPTELGAVEKRPIFQGFDLVDFRPDGEQQNIGFDKMWCVSESACNVIETNVNGMIHLEEIGQLNKEGIEVLKTMRHFGLIKDNACLLDTNYIAIGSGTTRRGNSQKKVGDFIRHNGLVPKETVSVEGDWSSNYNRKGGVSINGNRLPKESLELGKKIAEYLDISYEWVAPWNSKHTYKFGALQASIYAPSPKKADLYRATNNRRNHAVQRDGDEREYVEVFDSYPPFSKWFEKGYPFGYGMLYTLGLKKPLDPFNKEYIQSLKKKGWDYVLLVNDCETYTPGVYKLLDDSIEKAELKVVLNNGVQKLKADGKLEGISTEDFKRIINLK